VKIEDLEIELQQSKALCQIIPEGCLAGFDIYFCSRTLGKMKKSFTWKINDIHVFKVHIIAEVVPIEVQMSKSELVMEFPVDSLKPTLSSDIILTNPGNAYADFLWGSAGAFTCDPEKGSIAPGKSVVVSITWDPHSSKRTEEELGLHITGGIDQVLKVRGILPETKAEFSDKKINLGTMAVGTEKEVITSVLNSGQNPLVYFVNPFDAQLGFKIEPSEGCINPGESAELKMIITPRIARSYDNLTLTAKIRGGKSINLKIHGTSIVPDVELTEQSFRFGAVTVESLYRMPFNLSNKSSIAATLILDLSSFPDFAPVLINPLEPLDLATREFGPIPLTQEDDAGNHIVLVQPKMNKGPAHDDKNKKSSKRKHSSNCWKITVPANSSLKGELVFHPASPRKYSFKLPLTLLGVSDYKNLMRDVSAVGVATILHVSSYVVDFGDRVVSRDPLSRVSYFLETTLTNISQYGVSFYIREDSEVINLFDSMNPISTSNNGIDGNEPQQIFFVSPLKLDLAPGASAKLRVTFQPQNSANYSKKLGLFLKDQEDNDRPYLNLLCVGSGVFPCMSFSTEHLRLPTVPLGITSRAMFTIYNHGYASLEIKHRISPNISIPLEVTYPDGNQVGIMIDKIRVVISAKSDQQISWNGKIEFYDMDGERFFLTICGCSDNCLLTNYSFVREYSSDFGFIGLEDQPVQFLPLPQIADLRQIEAKRREELRKLRSLERQKAVEGKLGGVTTKSVSIQDSKSAKKGKDDGTIVSEKSSSTKPPLARKDTMLTEPKSYMDGIDIDRPITSPLPDDIEAIFLLKWLNRIVVKRQFDAETFPYCILENNADIVVECLEQISGKKIPLQGPKTIGGHKTLDSKSESDNSGAGKRASEKSKLIAAADKTLFKYQQIINFLVNYGGLLNHVNVISLLYKDDFLLLQEHEITKDKSIKFTPAMLNNRRKLWEDSWLDSCKRSWLEVLYQGIKVFILNRVNFKEYSTLPGVVLSTRNNNEIAVPSSTKQSKPEDKQKKKDLTPKELTSSNVFTHSELVLLSWISYHLEHAEALHDEGAMSSGNNMVLNLNSTANTFNKRVADITATFSDFYPFCQLIHSHVSDITKKGEPLHGYTTLDRSRTEEIYLRFEESLVQYHVDIANVLSEEIMKSGRNLVLMILHLYLSLPHLIPKTKIEFNGMLGVPICKKIELRNPSKKPLMYEVSLKGSQDYTLEARELIIHPESAVDFLVTLNARFTHTVQSKIYFWNVRDPSYATGATLSFQCSSQITGIRPTEKIQKQVTLFDLETFQLIVKNPFDRDINLKVKLEIKYCAKAVDDILGKSKPSRKKQSEVYKDIPLTKPAQDLDEFDFTPKNEESKSTTNLDDWDIENNFRQPFWVQEEALTIAKGGSKPLNVFMLPFQLGKYICQILFVEQELGEFSHEIDAEVTLPKSSEKLSMDILQGSISQLLFSLNSKNATFEKALSILTDMRIKNANKKIRARSVITNFLLSNVANEDNGSAVFLVDFTAPYFVYTKRLSLVSEYAKWAVKTTGDGPQFQTTPPNNMKLKKNARNSIELFHQNESGENMQDLVLNRLLLAFNPEKAGVYKTTAIIRPEDNPFDLRCVELSLTARIPDAKMLLEFNGPARKRIVQDIPISNETPTDWSLSIILSGKNFTAPKILNVPAGGTGPLEIAFFSGVSGNFEGKVQLKNSENGDIFDYQLLGIAEEPLAEDHLNFKCAARKKTAFTVPIPPLENLLGLPPAPAKTNSSMDEAAYSQTSMRPFFIESDLPFAHFPEKAKLPADGGNFEFAVSCPMGGELNGMISFKDQETNSIFWYAITIEVTSPSEEKTIDVQTTVRQAALVEITLNNPTDEELHFEVLIQGEGLLGEKSFVLKPKSSEASSKYELIFSPLFAGTFVGKVSFWSEIVGEVWYKLNLTAFPAKAIDLPMIECMLGSEGIVLATVENPLNENIIFTAEVEDVDHFAVNPAKISLAPFQQSSFQVKFRPTNLNDQVFSDIKLFNKKLGEILYRVSGKGLLPGVMPTTSIEGPLNEIVSENIQFRNPFSHPLPVEIYLSPDSGPMTNDQKEDAFSLLLRKASDVVISPKTVFHIPVSFSPSQLGMYSSILQIRAFVGGHGLIWCYPIQGMAEVGEAIKLPAMKVMSKSSLIKEHLIPLSGLQGLDQSQSESEKGLTLSDITLTLKMDDEVKGLVSRSFRIQPLELISLQNDGTVNIPVNPSDFPNVSYLLRTRLLFEPLRTFSANVEVSIVAKNKGKWKALIDLESTSPEPDDNIKLIAKVGDTDRVTFKLSNRFLGYSQFQAFFSANSSPHFSVYPTNGTLAPYDTDGTQFVVSFAPKEYGYIER
jgi:hypothetical protein